MTIENCTTSLDIKETQSFEAVPSGRLRDLNEAIETVVRVLAGYGVERMFIADLTRYDIPTVRVIAPELEFAPKALYRIHTPAREEARRLRQEPLRMGYVEGRDLTFLQGLGNDHLR